MLTSMQYSFWFSFRISKFEIKIELKIFNKDIQFKLKLNKTSGKDT